jgi:transcriptional regulator with GAF, ATPase, and Fis domain
MKSFNSDPPSTVMISMPAMIVPFERLSPKRYDFTTYQCLDANFEGGRGPQGPVLQLADKLEILSSPLSSTVRTLEEMERNQILKTLSETGWRIEKNDGAAAILGLNPSTLRARMHKLGIVRPQTKEPG